MGECQHDFCDTVLINGEKIKRSWLMYSNRNIACTASAAKLLSPKEYKLNKEGLKD